MTSPIEFAFPEIRRWAAGNAGTPYVHVFDSGKPGPTVMVNALTHGNEVSGAVTVDALLQANVRPRRGTLILSFANVAAYHSFDPAKPHASRFVDEDFNRVWGRLDKAGDTQELRRARELEPFVARADLLLDLHTMHEDCAALMLSGPLDRGVALAKKVGAPLWIVRDEGHPAGKRMRDYGGFGDPAGTKAALLLEAGQHWRADAVTVAKDVTARFLAATWALEAADLAAHLGESWLQPAPARQTVVEVTDAVATKTGAFEFAMPVAGLDVIAKAGTLLGRDGADPVVTPYDDCVLVMPSKQHAKVGATVVRLGRIVER
jgi:predicted deacylase